MSWVLTGEGSMFLSDSVKKKWPDKLAEPDAVYQPDPLSALRLLLEDHERRIKELEAEVDRLKEVNKNDTI